MRELLFTYADKFEENFPLMHFNGLEEKDVEKIIINAIETGKPVEVELIEGAVY